MIANQGLIERVNALSAQEAKQEKMLRLFFEFITHFGHFVPIKKIMKLKTNKNNNNKYVNARIKHIYKACKMALVEYTGMSLSVAAATASHIIEAECSGYASHEINRILYIIDNFKYSTLSPPRINKISSSIAQISHDGLPGYYLMKIMMN